MPIYEYYSPDTNKIYSFFAKTLAQGKQIPKCPDNPKARMVKLLSGFSIGGARRDAPEAAANLPAGDAAGIDDSKMQAAMSAMEREFSSVDKNDPRAMARMMRRMAELSGEKLDAPMEEVVRKLEEGVDPEALEDDLGDAFGPEGEDGMPGLDAAAGEPTTDAAARPKFKVRRAPPRRDPKLYDYDATD